MIKTELFIACLFFFFPFDSAFAQEEEESIRIMFWNVENLFDPFDDSLTRDEDFTSQGIYAWTWSRYKQKLNNIYKVIMSAGWEPPDIIGLSEVENRWVLERLTRETPLSKFEYRIIHKESPDMRGIDVALLYLPDSFKPIDKLFIPVTGLKPGDDPSRDILYVRGVVKSRDTINIFVNHWPSRYPGQVETIHKRKAAAAALKHLTDRLFSADPFCRIIIMGDFNDEPYDASISETLGAFVPGGENRFLPAIPEKKDTGIYVNSMPAFSDGLFLAEGKDIEFPRLSDNSTAEITITVNSLYCLIPHLTKTLPGTLKFQGRWYLFDQFIVSGGLLLKAASYKSVSHKSIILDHDFLLEPDENYTGRKPYRTYNGYIYKGGYSDHLPIVLELGFFRKYK